MNSLYDHHKDSIRWHYRCFDRILLNGLIQPFQQPERVVGFFNKLKHFRAIATRYDKLARNFLAGVHLACAIILLN